jgi:NAD(P)-dependent dehydrogenase (short-subunit alcohol dehydrogenase family)
MARFSGKIAIVTGGGGGIGSESARLLALDGAKVVIGDVNEEAAELAARSIVDAGGVAVAQGCDIADEESVKKLVATAVDRFGGLDLMHANAADTLIIDTDSNAVDVSFDVVRHSIDVNLIGTLLCVRHAIPQMLKRGGGAMAFTTSRAAHSGYPKVMYAMTKASIPALACHISSTWGKQGIRANCIAPGLIMTARAKAALSEERIEAIRSSNNVNRLGVPRDIAAAAAFFLSDDAGYINGQHLKVSGGQYY